MRSSAPAWRNTCGGTCVCGKRQFESRKAARRAASRLFPTEHMHAYKCRRSLMETWHFGHLDPEVNSGNLCKSERYSRRNPHQ